jgi:PncC family amidohydrolase
MQRDAQQLGKALLESRGMLATAESCTGGMIAEIMTQIAGASAWFVGGWVTYSNEMKTSQLDIDSNLLETHGAVSWQVAKAMCEGAMNRSGATASISTTGIAGPSGGSEEKPVGTVFIACSVPSEIQVREFRFKGTRDEIRKQVTTTALKMATSLIIGDVKEEICCQYGKIIR